MASRSAVAVKVTSPEGVSKVAIGVTEYGKYPVGEDGNPVTYLMSPLEAKLYASLIMDAAEKAELDNTDHEAMERRSSFKVLEGGTG